MNLLFRVRIGARKGQEVHAAGPVLRTRVTQADDFSTVPTQSLRTDLGQ